MVGYAPAVSATSKVAKVGSVPYLTRLAVMVGGSALQWHAAVTLPQLAPSVSEHHV